MNIFSWLQLIFYMVVLIALAKPIGLYMARVYQGEKTFLDPLLRPLEKWIYRLSDVHPDEDMNWKVYALAMMLFNGLGLLAVYAFQRLQGYLPLNPQGFSAVSPDSVLEHGRQLCHQHQLAGLRRRDHHELPDPDAGADHPELRLGRHRHGGRHRHDPGIWSAIRPKPSATSGWT